MNVIVTVLLVVILFALVVASHLRRGRTSPLPWSGGAPWAATNVAQARSLHAIAQGSGALRSGQKRKRASSRAVLRGRARAGQPSAAWPPCTNTDQLTDPANVPAIGRKGQSRSRGCLGDKAESVIRAGEMA